MEKNSAHHSREFWSIKKIGRTEIGEEVVGSTDKVESVSKPSSKTSGKAEGRAASVYDVKASSVGKGKDWQWQESAIPYIRADGGAASGDDVDGNHSNSQ